MNPRHSEIWLVDFGEPIGREQAGRRPAVVISDNELNDGPAGLVIVVPITSTRRGLPSHIELDLDSSGLDEISYAKSENIKSLSDRRLIARLGVADGAAIFEIKRAIRFLLDL